jgi:hypothetical protein
MVCPVEDSMARRKRSDAEQELDGLAEDWITLWQSEIAGLMADPELAEAWGALLGLGGAWLRAMAPGAGHPFARPHEPAPAATPATPRPPPAAAAPDAGRQPGRHGHGDAAAADAGRLMAERLAELERRLAEVERRPAGSSADRRPVKRRRAPA